jgi:hypothetical protein
VEVEEDRNREGNQVVHHHQAGNAQDVNRTDEMEAGVLSFCSHHIHEQSAWEGQNSLDSPGAAKEAS